MGTTIRLYDEDGFEIRPLEIEKTQKRIDYEFWLSPLGKKVKFFKGIEAAYSVCSLHSDIAYEVVKKLLGEDYARECRDCEKVLLKSGWIKLGCLGQRYDIALKEPTQSQIDVLFEMGIKELFIDEKLQKIL